MHTPSSSPPPLQPPPTTGQIAFWKNRQSEAESYAMMNRPLTFQVGNLSDALYFDFISYAQFVTIGRWGWGWGQCG